MNMNAKRYDSKKNTSSEGVIVASDHVAAGDKPVFLKNFLLKYNSSSPVFISSLFGLYSSLDHYPHSHLCSVAVIHTQFPVCLVFHLFFFLFFPDSIIDLVDVLD